MAKIAAHSAYDMFSWYKYLGCVSLNVPRIRTILVLGLGSESILGTTLGIFGMRFTNAFLRSQ